MCRFGDKKGWVVLPGDFSSKHNIQTSYFWIFPYGRVLSYGAGEPVGVLVGGVSSPKLAWFGAAWLFRSPALQVFSTRQRHRKKAPPWHVCLARVPRSLCPLYLRPCSSPASLTVSAPADGTSCCGQGGRGGMSKVQ